MDERKDEATAPRPRILCLQGFGQSTADFHVKLASLRNHKNYKKKYEFVMLEAPHELTEQKRCWFYYDETNRCNVDWTSSKQEKDLLGLDVTIDLLKETLSENTFEMILGFSQGGALLSLLCKKKLVPENTKVAFVGSFHPIADDEFKTSDYPSIHVYGQQDEVIPMKSSQA